ncbi:MAG TPA: tetratricopeptide repeat protein [Eoetvoesiella sp.]|uniref:tetratricopeptide repeat protein n=1 Tax=Eoetvoesiella sp. TaxID=1966355 RepID=UPI002C8FF532|nr:tetratricopeptide repeat protein [Eoetvoesiella sp.]HWK62121.1 tetratricopeptide repeat protein [Eoetvoesiella sp.]
MKPSNSVFLAVFSSLFLQIPAAALAAPEPGSGQHVEQIRLRAGEPPVVKLTGDLLYRILASEIAAQRGDYDTASQGYLDLAKDTSDPRLAKKAFQLSIVDRNMRRAQEAAQEWAFLAPGDQEAVASSLALAASNGQTAGMALALRERIAKASDKSTAIGQALVIVSKLNDKKVALEILDQALDGPARATPVAHLALSDAAWAAGDVARALGEARQALTMDPNSEPAAQRLLEYGLKDDPGQAIQSAYDFIDKHPQARRLQLLLASRLVDRKDFEGALALVHRMRQAAPEDFDLLYTEAEVNFQAGRYEQAKSLLNEYINVQTQRRQSIDDRASNAMSDASDARLLLVKIAEKQNRLDEAIKQLELIDDPALVFQARMHQAVLQGRLGNIPQARKTIDAAKAQSRHERAVKALTMSSIYRDAGRSDQAVEVLVKADKSLPDSAEIKFDLGMLYERQGKLDEFEKLMRRVIELEPNDADAYNALGYTLADQNTRLDEAQELLERALDLQPDSPFILDSVGWYFYRVNDLQAALGYLQRSYNIMPIAEVAAHLGEVLWKLKRHDEARKVWAAGMAKDPDNETLLKTLERFKVKLP